MYSQNSCFTSAVRQPPIARTSLSHSRCRARTSHRISRPGGLIEQREQASPQGIVPVTLLRTGVSGAVGRSTAGRAFVTLAARVEDRARVRMVARAPRPTSARIGRGSTACQRSCYEQGCLTRAAPDDPRLRPTASRANQLLVRSTGRRIPVAESRLSTGGRGSLVSASR